MPNLETAWCVIYALVFIGISIKFFGASGMLATFGFALAIIHLSKVMG